jgi:hypothetical protein
MNTNKDARWYKEIGGNWGTVKIGRKWVWYDCLLCARAWYPKQFKTVRWQGPPSAAIVNAHNNRTKFRVTCGGANMHKIILTLKQEKKT